VFLQSTIDKQSGKNDALQNAEEEEDAARIEKIYHAFVYHVTSDQILASLSFAKT
jgi:hypothetical protein